jgi:hypothetical protein
MQRGVALVAHQQAAVTMQPGEVALHHPALAPEPLARLAAAAGDPRDYTAAARRGAVAARTLAQVRVQLGGPPARAAGAAAGLLERWEMASTRRSSTVPWFTLAAVLRAASGVPWPSATETERITRTRYNGLAMHQTVHVAGHYF